MEKKRPIGVMILAILAVVGAIVAIFYTLQMLHLIPITGPFGQYKFFTFDLLGAILWGMLAAIYIWVARMLWNLDPQGWLFVAVLSTLNLDHGPDLDPRQFDVGGHAAGDPYQRPDLDLLPAARHKGCVWPGLGADCKCRMATAGASRLAVPDNA